MLVFSQALPFPNDGSVEQPGLHERIQYLKRVPMYKNRIDFRSIVDMYDPVLFALFSSLIGWRQFQVCMNCLNPFRCVVLTYRMMCM